MAFRSIQDRWYVIDPGTGQRRPSARHGKGLRYRARYRDTTGNEVTKAFPDKEKSKAQRWLDEVTASQVTGTYVDPKNARTTVAEWCETWLSGYATRRPRTVRQAQVHVAQIEAAFGSDAALGGAAVVRAVVDGEAQGRRPGGQLRLRAALAAVADHERRRARRAAGAKSVLAAHVARCRRSAAVRRHDRAGVGVARRHRRPPASGDPARCVRRAADRRGRRPARRGRRLHEGRRPAGAAACGGAAQERRWLARRCRSRRNWRWSCRRPSRDWGGDSVVTDGTGRQTSTWAIERAIRSARPKVPGLPEGFRFHDLRHYLASLLIASGPGREGRPAPAPARQREDDAGHLRPSVAGQRRVRTGRRRCCAGSSWGLVGD